MIDTSIYNRIQPMQIDDPADVQAQALQLRQARQQNKLADMVFAEKERGMREAGMMADLYRNALDPDGKLNRTKILTGAASGGLGSKIPSLQKQFADEDEAQGKLAKQKSELIDARLKQSRAFLENVTTPEQYIAWHEANHKDPILGPELAARGVTAEQARASIMQAITQPGGLEKMLNQSRLGIEKFAELNMPKLETRDAGGTIQTMAIDPFTGAPRVTGSIQKTMTPDARAADARAKERLAFDKSMPRGQYDAERGLLIDPRTGVATPVKGQDGAPIGIKDKLPESQQKQVVGVQNLSRAIQEYRDELKNFGVGAGLNPSKRAVMGTKYNNMMLQAKEAYNLGVLNGPDLDILTSVITDPRSLKGTFTPNSALDKQASELDRIMQDVAQVSSQPKPRGGVGPGAAKAPAGEIKFLGFE